jgi:hypothetical protein
VVLLVDGLLAQGFYAGLDLLAAEVAAMGGSPIGEPISH